MRIKKVSLIQRKDTEGTEPLDIKIKSLKSFKGKKLDLRGTNWGSLANEKFLRKTT